MWVNKRWFDSVIESNKWQQDMLVSARQNMLVSAQIASDYQLQKSKDDITIDWMRHRINALEKERTILLQKAAGILLPTPEIEITPARQAVADLNWEHGFNDVGDDEAKRLGLSHDEEGHLLVNGQLAV